MAIRVPPATQESPDTPGAEQVYVARLKGLFDCKSEKSLIYIVSDCY